jgi:hypothetical protein
MTHIENRVSKLEAVYRLSLTRRNLYDKKEDKQNIEKLSREVTEMSEHWAKGNSQL